MKYIEVTITFDSEPSPAVVMLIKEEAVEVLTESFIARKNVWMKVYNRDETPRGVYMVNMKKVRSIFVKGEPEQ